MTIGLQDLAQVHDYPSADMTITVGAGITMQALDRILSASGQRLPLDVPQEDRATLGGVLATNSSGFRRFGNGTARDYVIGIRAIDGRGASFAGGGRVVKNVAGYDFCKLLIGSHGALGIITEVTLKLKPRVAVTAALLLSPRNLEQLEWLLARLMQSPAQPVAIEWLRGPWWQALADREGWPTSHDDAGWLVVVLEGTPGEVDWMETQLRDQWRSLGDDERAWLPDREHQEHLLSSLREFAAAPGAATMLKANVVPSATVSFAQQLHAIAPQASIQAHAGNGILKIRFESMPTMGLGTALTRHLQPAAIRASGNLVVLSNSSGQELTQRARWGNPSGPLKLMQSIKQQFDPYGILNPNQWVI
jgi:glycolate oxidase FAD binding subunit